MCPSARQISSRAVWHITRTHRTDHHHSKLICSFDTAYYIIRMEHQSRMLTVCLPLIVFNSVEISRTECSESRIIRSKGRKTARRLINLSFSWSACMKISMNSLSIFHAMRALTNNENKSMNEHNLRAPLKGVVYYYPTSLSYFFFHLECSDTLLFMHP